MSLSDQSKSSNPAKRFLEIKSGKVQFYDKEEGQNVEVATPFEFTVLDTLATVKGWSDADDSGFWSNEVRSVGKDPLTVRTKHGAKASGIWKEIKTLPELAGAKYFSSIYIAANGRDGLEINNLRLSGAALKAWIAFAGTTDLRKNKVVLSGWSDEKKGAVKYQAPIFEAVPFKGDEKDQAIVLDQELKEYLTEYFSYVPDAEQAPANNSKDVVLDDIDDDPIDLSEIPF